MFCALYTVRNDPPPCGHTRGLGITHAGAPTPQKEITRLRAWMENMCAAAAQDSSNQDAYRTQEIALQEENLALQSLFESDSASVSVLMARVQNAQEQASRTQLQLQHALQVLNVELPEAIQQASTSASTAPPAPQLAVVDTAAPPAGNAPASTLAVMDTAAPPAGTPVAASSQQADTDQTATLADTNAAADANSYGQALSVVPAVTQAHHTAPEPELSGHGGMDGKAIVDTCRF